jgi:glycosyltransferase involved in cell wall biosynthesis
VGAQRREDDTAAQLFDALVGAHRQAPYDALHGFYLVRAGFLAAYAGRYLGVPALVSARGNDLDRALFDPTARAGILRALDLATVVTAVSRDLARKARALAPEARVEVVANGVDATLFRPQPRDARRLASLALEGRAIVGFSGELRLKKGLVPLLEALARLGETRPVSLLAVGGVRRDDEAVLTLFRRRHAHVPIATLDWRDAAELPSLYALMDVFAHPSLRDGLPNALLEAMACARPCVATTAGGIPDALRDGVEGRLVEPGDAGALAAAIAELLDDRGRAQRLGQAARERVESEFTPEREIERYLELYAS